MAPGGLPKEEDPPEAGHTPGEAPSTILQDIAQNAGWRLPLLWLLGTGKKQEITRTIVKNAWRLPIRVKNKDKKGMLKITKMQGCKVGVNPGWPFPDDGKRIVNSGCHHVISLPFPPYIFPLDNSFFVFFLVLIQISRLELCRSFYFRTPWFRHWPRT